MSFEDDMIEYGFTDSNDYIDYLYNVADKIFERQEEQEHGWKEHEEWLESLSGEEIADWSKEKNDQKEDTFQKKQREIRQQRLDDGDYVLKETKTPDEYNTANDIAFTIKADHSIESDAPELKSLSGDKVTGNITLKADKAEGSLSTPVQNLKGSVLPSTGGAGRVAIYVIGAILVVGGGIVLVTKKRVK